MNMTSILGEYDFTPKPVTVPASSRLHQQWPSDSYSMGDDGDELLITGQGNVSVSEMESDQSSLYSEGISYEDTGSDYNDDSLDDRQTVHTCRQCCTVGSDELVIPNLHNWSLPSDSDHTTLCKYCREEVKNCYYDHHLVRCVEHCREYAKGTKTNLHDQANKHSSLEEETRHFNGYSFAVNCIATQETTHIFSTTCT